jgi:carboxymethylenebutenolidase
MCHSDDSRPPGATDGVPTRSTQDLSLTASDGNQLMAFEARAAQPTGAGIVVMPDVRGLHEFYKELAIRFAEVGIEAVAIDYFGRTAETPDRSEAFEFMPHVEKLRPDGIATDVQAAAAHLRSLGTTAVFTVGFCLGGAYAWRQSADTPGLAGAIGFYGRPDRVGDSAAGMTAPLLMLVAGADAHIPVSDVEALADKARAAGVAVDVKVYADAPHSFFDRSFAEHRDDCADAWSRVRDFVAKNS